MNEKYLSLTGPVLDSQDLRDKKTKPTVSLIETANDHLLRLEKQN